jgi:hypothetical protein
LTSPFTSAFAGDDNATKDMLEPTKRLSRKTRLSPLSLCAFKGVKSFLKTPFLTFGM